jgi:4-amino-4-deoxy-L-arabinose transferase-like glycosyltransferase
MEEVKGELKESLPEKEIEQRKNSIKKKFSYWIKDNYDKIFIALLVVAFIIRILIFIKTMNQPLWWDEADYMSAAKKWGLGLNNIVDIWYYRRGFLWPAIGAAFYGMGLGEIGMKFLVVLLSTGTVALSYFVIAKMFDKKSALLVSIGIAFSWISLFFTGRVLTDIPATFFLLIALLFFWKGYVLKEGNKFLYLFGIFYACALLVRFQFAMFALPFLVFMFTRERFKFLKNKHIWITIGLAFAVLLPFLILYWMHYGNVFTDILRYYFGVQGVSSSTGAYNPRTISTLFDYFKNLPYILTTSIFLLFIVGIFIFFQDMILGIDKIFKNEEIQKKFFIFLWIVVPFLVLGYISAYVEQRYVYATLPFLFLIAVSPLIKLGDVIHKHYSKISKKTGYILSIIFLLFLLVIPLGTISSNYSSANSLIDNKLASYSEVEQAGLWLKANSNPGDLIMTQSRPQIVYYAERSVQPMNLDMFANQSFFESVVKELKPAYLVLSSYEQSPSWVYTYPQNHTGLLTPVQAYPQNQPMVIVYRFNYS